MPLGEIQLNGRVLIFAALGLALPLPFGLLRRLLRRLRLELRERERERRLEKRHRAKELGRRHLAAADGIRLVREQLGARRPHVHSAWAPVRLG